MAARATYNMAIANEVDGKLDTALEWANKAYTTYNLKAARNYSQILQFRIEQQKKVEIQMRSKTNTPAPTKENSDYNENNNNQDR